MIIPRRHLLLGGATASLGAACISRSAFADTRFVDFAFPASGEPTPRTMPARLAEIKNVKDFGAVGNGMANDTAAIQAAVNWTAGADRGTIYFPLGAYLVSAPITFNYDGDLSIRFLGETNGSLIFGTFNGYIFDRHLATPNNTPGGRIFEKLSLNNGGATGGCIRVGSSDGVAIRDCILGANINITTEDAVGASSKNVFIENVVFSSKGTVSGSHHIIIGGGGVIQGCSITGADTAVRAYGSGLHCAGNRTERNNTAWLLGLDSGGNNVGLSGFSIMSGSTEGNWTSFDLAGLCSGFVIGSVAMLGHTSSNAGVTPGIMGTQYGVRVRADCAQAGLISGLSHGSVADVACFAIADATSRANLAFIDCSGTQVGGAGVNWLLPATAQAVSLENCNTSSVWTFSQLPTGSNVFEGDEFDISDSPVGTWGTNVTLGGGSTRVLVRWNGSNWTVVGI